MTTALDHRRASTDMPDVRVRVGGGGSIFVPELALTRWGIARVACRLLHNEPGIATMDQRAVVWTTRSIEARFYPLRIAGGGHEFALHLYRKPTTNTFRFAFATNGLAVSEQRGYRMRHADGSTSEPHPRGGTRICPAWAVNSFAIYSRWSGNYEPSGGWNFGTGKVCHLHRPFAVDAVGHQVWCTQTLRGGILAITVPQDFLQSAVYPICVDPTFGFTGIGANIASGSSHVNRYWGTRGLPASGGTVDKISCYTQTGTSSNTVKGAVVLYSTKVIITNGVSNSASLSGVVSSPGWVDMTMPTPPTVTATDYYVGYLGGGTDAWGSHYYDTAGIPAAESVYDSSNNFTTPTDPTDGSDEAERPSTYATYTADAGPSTDEWNVARPEFRSRIERSIIY